MPATPWPPAMVGGAFVLVALLALFAPTVASLGRLWWSSDAYGHGLLVFPLSLYLVWRRRAAISRRTPHIMPWGFPLLALCSIAWAMAYLVHVQVAQQLILVVLLGVVVWALFGSEVLKPLAFPIALLLLAVPVWDVLVPSLQRYTAVHSAYMLRALGVPVFLDGQHLAIPAGDFVVADVCAGLRYLLATLSVAVLYASLTYRTALRGAVLVAGAAMLAVALNWVRVVIVVFIGHLTQMQHPLVRDHMWIGWALFGLGLVPLFALGAWLREEGAPPAAPQVSADGSACPGRSRRWTAATLVALAALAIGPAVAHAIKARQPPAATIVVPSIAVPAGWAGPLRPDVAWRPRFTGAQARQLVSYERAGRRVTLFIAYYRTESQGAELVNEDNTLYDTDSWDERRSVQRRIRDVQGGAFPVQETELRAGGRSRLVWSWYYADGRFMAGRVDTKLHQLWGLLRGAPGAALVAVAADAAPEEARRTLGDFVSAAAPSVAASLAAVAE